MEQVGPSLDGAGQCSAGCSIAKPSTDNGGHIDECTRPHGLVGGKSALAPDCAHKYGSFRACHEVAHKVIEDYPLRTALIDHA